MPNPGRLAPLLNYDIDRRTFLTPDGLKTHNTIWNRVNWRVVGERLESVLDQSTDKSVTAISLQPWHLEHLELFKGKQSVFVDSADFFESQRNNRDNSITEGDLRAYYFSNGLNEDQVEAFLRVFNATSVQDVDSLVALLREITAL